MIWQTLLKKSLFPITIYWLIALDLHSPLVIFAAWIASYMIAALFSPDRIRWRKRIYFRKRRERGEKARTLVKKNTVSVSGRADGSQSCSWLANASSFQRDSREDDAGASGPVCVTCRHANAEEAAIQNLNYTLLPSKQVFYRYLIFKHCKASVKFS